MTNHHRWVRDLAARRGSSSIPISSPTNQPEPELPGTVAGIRDTDLVLAHLIDDPVSANE
jgi:hypothetical protein